MTQIKVDNVVDAAGTAAADFTSGLTVAGAALSTLNTAEYYETGTEPTSPKNGAIWKDTTNNKVMVYIAGEFKEVELNAAVGGASWTVDLSNVTYDNKTASLTSQDSTPFDIAFNSDGTKMYMIGQSGDYIHQYSLSTALDISTASYDNVSLFVGSQENVPTSLAFNDDGTKVYITGEISDKVHQYSLSTAFDMSTGSYNNVFFSWSAGTFAKSICLRFNPAGTKMYLISEEATRPIYQYTLSTAFDVSTASYDNVSFALSSQDTGAQSINFNTDGTKMYMIGTTSDSVFQYSLSTGFDLSTASYDSVSFSTSAQQAVAVSLSFSPDGTKMYISGLTPVNTAQYSTGL